MNRIAKTERTSSELIDTQVTPQKIGLDRLEYYKFIDENGTRKITTKERNNVEKTKKIRKDLK